MSETDPDVNTELDAILAEYFPDGLPPSATAAAAARGEATVISTKRQPRPILDLETGAVLADDPRR